jgi:hypothetical protein
MLKVLQADGIRHTLDGSVPQTLMERYFATMARNVVRHSYRAHIEGPNMDTLVFPRVLAEQSQSVVGAVQGRISARNRLVERHKRRGPYIVSDNDREHKTALGTIEQGPNSLLRRKTDGV